MRTTDAALSAETPHKPTGPADRPLRVLFIEDSALDHSLLVRLLENSGHVLAHERVEDEEGMRAALARGTWDAVISDHVLPNFSSTRALQVFKEGRLDVPFLIVSAEIGEDVAVEAMRAGADDYVLKSRLARLVPALRRGLAAAQARRDQRAAERALRTSEEQLRSITANLPGIVFRIAWPRSAPHWHFEYVSEGAPRLLGLSRDDMLQSPEAFLACFAREDRDALEDLLARGEKWPDLRWRAGLSERGAETMQWVELACTRRPADDGTSLWEGVLIDITAQKTAEEALRDSREELRALSAHLDRVKEEERKSISREIHDDIGGSLTRLRFDLAWLREHGTRDDATRTRLDAMEALLDNARRASERIMRDLRPRILDMDVVAALEWQARDFAQRYDIPCRFRSNRESIQLDEQQRTALFRVCQEALTNIAKHAGACSVAIDLFADAESVSLEVADDGCGIDPEHPPRENRFGLRGLRERAEALGGWLELGGAPGKGTVLMFSLPAGVTP